MTHRFTNLAVDATATFAPMNIQTTLASIMQQLAGIANTQTLHTQHLGNINEQLSIITASTHNLRIIAQNNRALSAPGQFTPLQKTVCDLSIVSLVITSILEPRARFDTRNLGFPTFITNYTCDSGRALPHTRRWSHPTKLRPRLDEP